jgi:hypothetical protein
VEESAIPSDYSPQLKQGDCGCEDLVKEGKKGKVDIAANVIIGTDDVYQDTTTVPIPVNLWALYMDQ